jgi:transposase
LTKTEPIHPPPALGNENCQEQAPVTRGSWIWEAEAGSGNKTRQKTVPGKLPAKDMTRDIRRATRRHFSAEEKIRIVLDGFRGEESIAEICRREWIASSMYYSWSKEFHEAGKKSLAGDTARAATSDEVKALCRESLSLKEAVADLTLENRLLKKSMNEDGENEA